MTQGDVPFGSPLGAEGGSHWFNSCPFNDGTNAGTEEMLPFLILCRSFNG